MFHKMSNHVSPPFPPKLWQETIGCEKHKEALSTEEGEDYPPSFVASIPMIVKHCLHVWILQRTGGCGVWPTTSCWTSAWRTSWWRASTPPSPSSTCGTGPRAGKIFSDGVKIFVFRVWHFGSVYCIINQFISLTTVGVTCSLHCPHTNTVWRLQENKIRDLHNYNIYALSYLSASQLSTI